jgi:hypothetical protein
MAGTTNFVQTNPSAANQENDATYDSDSLTVGGIGVDDILPSPWLNKAWHQSSTFVCALAYVIANWGSGFTITDTSLATLKTNLTNFFNQFKVGSFSFAFPGYITLPGGFIVQWGTTGSLASDTAAPISFPYTFPNACLAVIGTDTFAGSKSATWSMYSWGTSSFTARCDGNTATATFIAVGW